MTKNRVVVTDSMNNFILTLLCISYHTHAACIFLESKVKLCLIMMYFYNVLCLLCLRTLKPNLLWYVCLCLVLSESALYMSTICRRSVWLLDVCFLSPWWLSAVYLTVYTLSAVRMLYVYILSVSLPDLCVVCLPALSAVCLTANYILSAICILFVYCQSAVVCMLCVWRMSVYSLFYICLLFICCLCACCLCC